jgi:hypothetical protein
VRRPLFIVWRGPRSEANANGSLRGTLTIIRLSWLEATMAPPGPWDSDGEGGEQASEEFEKQQVDPDASGMDVDDPREPAGDAKSPTGESGGDFGGGGKPPPNDPTWRDPEMP